MTLSSVTIKHVRSFENTSHTSFFGLHCVKLTGNSQRKGSADVDFFTEYGEGNRYKIEEVIVVALKKLVDYWNLSTKLNLTIDPCNKDATWTAEDANPRIACECSSTACQINHLKIYALDISGDIPREVFELNELMDLATDASGYVAVRFDCVKAAWAAITDLNVKLFWGNYRLHVSSFIMVSLYGFPERAYYKLSLEILGSISKQYLRDFFSPFGHVSSVTIEEKLPKGEEFADVAFQDSKTADRASDAAMLHPHLIYLGRTREKTSTFRALGERDAKKIVSKQLHLNLFEAQTEDEQQKTQRSQVQVQAQTHAQFYQMRPAALTSPGGSLPVYHLLVVLLKLRRSSLSICRFVILLWAD